MRRVTSHCPRKVVLLTKAAMRLRSSRTRAFLSSLFFELVLRVRLELQNGGPECVRCSSTGVLRLSGRFVSLSHTERPGPRGTWCLRLWAC